MRSQIRQGFFKDAQTLCAKTARRHRKVRQGRGGLCEKPSGFAIYYGEDMRFGSHYKMTGDDVIDYVFEHTNFFSSNENLICEEIGDGNINYVYRITDPKNKKSVILKQADVQTRVRPDGYLSPERSAREAEVLKTEFRLAPEFVPEIFHSDKTMAVIIMEDIGSYSNLKKELMKGRIFPGLGTLLARFIVKTTLPLTGPVLGSAEKTELMFKFRNPELCKITEDLVFTHPYNDLRKRNIVLPENKDWLEKKLYTKELQCKAARLKEKFDNYPQSLIHGDLHSGSVFVQERGGVHIKVIDPEFAFYGPIGYDLGNVLAHFIFAELYIKHCRGTGLSTSEKEKFSIWINGEKNALFTVFAEEGASYLRAKTECGIYRNDDFIKQYIEDIKNDAAAFAGTELNRRVIGSAKTAEITGVHNIEERIAIERDAVIIGTKMMTSGCLFLKGL